MIFLEAIVFSFVEFFLILLTFKLLRLSITFAHRLIIFLATVGLYVTVNYVGHHASPYEFSGLFTLTYLTFWFTLALSVILFAAKLIGVKRQ